MQQILRTNLARCCK